MSVAFEIRLLTADDVPRCGAILDSLDGWFGQETSNRAYEQSLYRLPAAVATVDGRMVGFLALTEHTPDSVEIEVMGVEEDCHRQGIGRALIEWAELWCRDRRVQWLHVKTRGPSTPDPEYALTRLFYRACGFHPLFESLTHWGPDDAALFLVKNLTSPPGADIVREHKAELRLVDIQAQTLREEVRLKTIEKHGQSGVPSILSNYLVETLATDEIKSTSLTAMLRDGESNFIDCADDELYGLLTNPSMPLQPGPGAVVETLAQMKAVHTPTRFGDMVFLPADSDLFVIGDTHGNPTSTASIIAEIVASEAFANGAIVVFMGDYVNNGLRSRENVRQILNFQRNHPDSVVLLSGNHDFRESYGTALNEYFQVHWNLLSDPALLAMPDRQIKERHPSTGRHYGHIRLELMRSMGFENGESTYQAYADWGKRLPFICICGDILLSHSLGRLDGNRLRFVDLLYAKQVDAAEMTRLGYEAWNARRDSAHSALVNNRVITSDLVAEFQALLAVDQFVVGHCHYRSGDTIAYGDATVTTVVSSNPASPDAGHYMFHEMEINRSRRRDVEGLPAGPARAYYLQFSRGSDGRHIRHVVPVSA